MLTGFSRGPSFLDNYTDEGRGRRSDISLDGSSQGPTAGVWKSLIARDQRQGSINIAEATSGVMFSPCCGLMPLSKNTDGQCRDSGIGQSKKTRGMKSLNSETKSKLASMGCTSIAGHTTPTVIFVDAVE